MTKRILILTTILLLGCTAIAAAAYIEGDNGPDDLDGGPNADIVVGYGGPDNLDGHGGADQVWGGGDDDHLYGGDQGDYLVGQQGNDIIYGEGGNDELDAANDGADVLICGGGFDQYKRGPGDYVDQTCEQNIGKR